jgi:hypothetical protein
MQTNGAVAILKFRKNENFNKLTKEAKALGVYLHPSLFVNSFPSEKKISSSEEAYVKIWFQNVIFIGKIIQRIYHNYSLFDLKDLCFPPLPMSVKHGCESD